MNNLGFTKGKLSILLTRIWTALLVCTVALPSSNAWAQGGDLTPAKIVNDEGGPVSVTGKVTYTNEFFAEGVASPMVILEDEAGFVDRNQGFILPKASQVLGQITSDFHTSPFSYMLELPAEPQASLRDVDNNGKQDKGVMIYAIAYWNNTFGDPFLEERDLGGGGWSTAYASTRVIENAATKGEIVGGKLLVWAPDDQQGFSAGFGKDGLLFTADDPIVGLPPGYTIVNLDTDPFTFDRSRHPVIDLIEPKETALADFSGLSYTKAFDAMLEKIRKEYAFTEYKQINWDDLGKQFRPRFVEAEKAGDKVKYWRALRDFAWAIPDGHVGVGYSDVDGDYHQTTDGGIGMTIHDVDDGRILVTTLRKAGPADEAGIQLRAELLKVNGMPVNEFVDNTIAWSGPFSSPHTKHLEQLRYALRSPIGAKFELVFQNSGDAAPKTVSLTAVDESKDFASSAAAEGLTGFENPVEYKKLASGYAYVKIFSFEDNDFLTVQLWERILRILNENKAPGLIIDMRQNYGGNGFLANQMAAYFFKGSLMLGNTGYYDDKLGKFYFDPRTMNRFYLPSDDLRYYGPVDVLIGPHCFSGCEFFAFDLTLENRATIVGQYPTAGLGASVSQFKMPEDVDFRFPIGRAVDVDGNIHIEGKGVAPTIKVPVDEETLFSDGDPILEAAVDHLKQVAPLAQESPAKALVDAGDQKTNKGNYDDAIADYTKALEADAKYAPAFSSRGYVYYQQEKYDEAIADYTKALALDPQLAAAYNGRGNVYYSQGKYSKSIDDYTKAIELDAKDAVFYANRGGAYAQLQKYEQALADYTKALAVDPGYAVAYKGRGDIYHSQAKYAEALADYTKAIELDGKYVAAYSERGDVYDSQGKYDLALADYTKALELDPEWTAAYMGRGFVYYHQAKYNQAIRDQSKAIELYPQYAWAYVGRGLAYHQQKKEQEALADYTKAIELEPQFAAAYKVRGDFYTDRGEYSSALEDYNKALEINPKSALAYLARGSAYAHDGNYGLAIADYSKAIELDAQLAEAYYERGVAYEKKGNATKAQEDYKKAADLGSADAQKKLKR